MAEKVVPKVATAKKVGCWEAGGLLGSVCSFQAGLKQETDTRNCAADCNIVKTYPFASTDAGAQESCLGFTVLNCAVSWDRI